MVAGPDDVLVRRTAEVGPAHLSLLEAGDGEPVLLLHGTPTSAELWRDVLERLAAAGYQGLAPDLPGYGRTRLPAGADHSLAAAATLLARWLEGRGSEPVWLVGHDVGGAVAQLLVARHPALVARLTLVNSIVEGCWPAPRARVATMVAKLGLYRPAARLGVVPNRYMRRQVRRSCATPSAIADEDLERVVWDSKFSTAEGRLAFQRHLAALTARDTASLPGLLPRIAAPSQVVWGLRDPFQTWAEAGVRLQQLLPDPSVTKLASSGHLVPMEDPDGLVGALATWRGGTR